MLRGMRHPGPRLRLGVAIIVCGLLSSCSSPEARAPEASARTPSAPDRPQTHTNSVQRGPDVERAPAHSSFTREVDIDAPLRLPAGAPALLLHVSMAEAQTTLARVVFFHGYSACVRALAQEGPTSCGEGLPTRPGWGLAHAADDSGESLALLLPQLAFLTRDGSVGRWAARGVAGEALEAGLRRGWEDSDQGALPPGPWVVIAHSGGFEAAASAIDGGGLPARTLILLDALYDGVPRFARWLAGDPQRRLISVHRTGGTPARMTRALSRRVARELGPGSGTESSLDDLAEALRGHSLVTVRVATPHADIPTRHLAELLRAVLPSARTRESATAPEAGDTGDQITVSPQPNTTR